MPGGKPIRYMVDIFKLKPESAIYIRCVNAELPAFEVEEDWLVEGQYYRFLGFVETALNHGDDMALIIGDAQTNRVMKASPAYRSYRSSRFDMEERHLIVLYQN